MPDFSRKKVTVETVGDQLLSLRGARSLTVDDIAQRTKIRTEYIAAIEANDWQNLPSSTYVRGYIRTYARVVGGNISKLLRCYDRQINVEQPQQKSVPHVLESRHNLSSFVLSRTFWIIFALGIVGAVAAYLYVTLRTFTATPFLLVSAPINGMTVYDPALAVAGRTIQGVTVHINGRDVLVDHAGDFTQMITLSPGVNTIVIKAVNRLNKTTQEVIMVNFEDMTPVAPVEVTPVESEEIDVLDENGEVANDSATDEGVLSTEESPVQDTNITPVDAQGVSGDVSPSEPAQQ
jgi:hypothetical protein